MKRFAVLLILSLLLISLSSGGRAQGAAENVTKQITVHFRGFDKTGTYTGEAINGVPNGTGSFTSVNDDQLEWTYTGQWKDGAFDGEGSTVWEDGWEERGLYVQNVLVSGQWVSNGTILYDGSFAWSDEEGNELYDGEGSLYNDLGLLIFTGQFSMGYLVETAQARQQRADDLAPSCAKLTKKDHAGILKNEDAWIGKMVQFQGNVTYVWWEDDHGYGEFEVSLNRSEKHPLDVYYRYAADEKRVKLGQSVTVLGTVTGVYRYDDGTGHPYVAPMVQADVILSR